MEEENIIETILAFYFYDDSIFFHIDVVFSDMIFFEVFLSDSSSGICSWSFLPKVSGKGYKYMHVVADKIANNTIGLCFLSANVVKINWLPVEAIAPPRDTIPNPVPLNGKGNISVMYKKNTAI